MVVEWNNGWSVVELMSIIASNRRQSWRSPDVETPGPIEPIAPMPSRCRGNARAIVDTAECLPLRQEGLLPREEQAWNAYCLSGMNLTGTKSSWYFDATRFFSLLIRPPCYHLSVRKGVAKDQAIDQLGIFRSCKMCADRRVWVLDMEFCSCERTLDISLWRRRR